MIHIQYIQKSTEYHCPFDCPSIPSLKLSSTVCSTSAADKFASFPLSHSSSHLALKQWRAKKKEAPLYEVITHVKKWIYIYIIICVYIYVCVCMYMHITYVNLLRCVYLVFVRVCVCCIITFHSQIHLMAQQRSDPLGQAPVVIYGHWPKIEVGLVLLLNNLWLPVAKALSKQLRCNIGIMEDENKQWTLTFSDSSFTRRHS